MLSCYECVVVRAAVRVLSRLRLEVMYIRGPVNWNFGSNDSNLQIRTSAAWTLLIRPFFWSKKFRYHFNNYKTV